MGATSNQRRSGLQPLDRRTFLRSSLIGATGLGLSGFAASSFGFLWPRLGDALVGEIAMGDANELVAQITAERTPVRVPAAGLSIVVWDPSNSAAQLNYGDHHQAVLDGTAALMALDSANCPHLGCGVPWCQTSQWFECPCHGSRYNRWGEWTGGPAPRGLDRYPSFIDEATNQFVVDFGTKLTGTARTANSLEQSPEGPACVDI
jgi:cytochrome b6-f complex iron-sulfur subunit